MCGEGLENFVILSAVLLLIKSTVASAAFLTTLLGTVVNASVEHCLVWSRRIMFVLSLEF